MSKKLTSRERFQRTFEHKEADRVPITDYPWSDTIERWQREGMPKDVHFADYFDIDHIGMYQADNSPQYPEKVVEETDAYVVKTTKWGATLRNWKHASSTPEFLDFTIIDRDSWEKARKRMTPDASRIDWEALKKDYILWKEKGWWTQCAMWYGFDPTHSWVVGTERLLMALVEDPEWCVDMFNHFLDVQIALTDRIIDAGFTFDSSYCWDDLGFKNSLFFSVKTFRELLKPVHKRAFEWAHSRGMRTELHSCGMVMQLVPEFVEIGLDCLNPLEVKAGMDPLRLKKEFGKKLVLHGGLNASVWGDREKFDGEMRRLIPALKKSGGYICGSDHSVPSSVSLADFRRFVDLAKELGAY